MMGYTSSAWATRKHLKPENLHSSVFFPAQVWFHTVGLLPLRFNIHLQRSYTSSTGNTSCSPSLPSAAEMDPNIYTPRKHEKQQRQQAKNTACLCVWGGGCMGWACVCVCVWRGVCLKVLCGTLMCVRVCVFSSTLLWVWTQLPGAYMVHTPSVAIGTM